MNLKHFEVHVSHRGTQYMGSWRVCQSESLDHATNGESDIPLGKRMNIAKLEEFCLNCIAAANKTLLNPPPK